MAGAELSPLLHKYAYGATPPANCKLMAPLDSPKQRTCVRLAIEFNSSGCAMMCVPVRNWQPFASITAPSYDPAGKPLKTFPGVNGPARPVMEYWNGADRVDLLPNPSNGEVLVKWENLKTGNGQITLLTLDGKQIAERVIEESTGNWDLTSLDLQSGVYLVFFQINRQHVPFKLIVMN